MEDRELNEWELRQRIQAGIDAAEELKRRLASLDRCESSERPKLRLIKGGAIAVAVCAGVEWLRASRRTVVGVLASTAAAGGIAYLAPSIVAPSISEPPAADAAPPPRHIARPSRPPTHPVSVAPKPTPRPASPAQSKASPPRTSPPRATLTPTQSPATTASTTAATTAIPSVDPSALPTAVRSVTDLLKSTTRLVIPPRTPSASEQPDCPLLGLDPVGVCLDLSGDR